MKFYKLRVDTEDKIELKNLLIKYTEVFLIGLENGGTNNPHCHVYFETTHQSSAIRMAIRKKYGSGNGVYSLKELDEKQPIEYISYCLKENNFIHTLDEEFITKCKEWNTKIQTEMKEKKEGRKTILQKIEEYYEYASKDENDFIDWTRNQVFTPIGKGPKIDIVRDVIDYYQKHEILVREFQMVSQIQTLKLKYDKTYSEQLYCSLKNKLN